MILMTVGIFCCYLCSTQIGITIVVKAVAL